MASTITIPGYIHMFYKKYFQTPDAGEIAWEPYLIFGFVYCINGQIVEAILAESRHGFAECDDSSSLRAFIQEKEPLPLDTIVDPQNAEMIRETITDRVRSLVRDCDGVQGLNMLQVFVVFEINQDEEDHISTGLSDADFLRERRMSLLQNNVCVCVTMAETENEACAICLAEMRTGQEVVCTPCVHRFHRACIARWFETTGFCPLCRFKIEPF